MQNTDTTLFSFQPDNSKWWCIGAILNNLFPPVFLKYTTCNTTDMVSITGIAAIINNMSGICKYNAIVAITPPNNSEPVSPINTCAVFKLNIKNPKHAPIIMLPNTTISFTSKMIATTVRHVVIIAAILVLNPSIPSVKLTAFVVASITKIANGIYANTGNINSCFINGIIVDVPKLAPFNKYKVNKTDIISSPIILLDGFNPMVFFKQ